MRLQLVAAISLFTLNIQAASLPDEINYTPYKIQYEKLASRVSNIENNLSRLNSDLQDAFNAEASTVAAIDRLNNDISNTNYQINNHVAERRDLQIKKQEIRRNIQDLEQTIADLESTISSVRNNLANKKNLRRRLRGELDNILTKLQAATTSLNNAVSRKNRLVSQRNSKKNQLQTTINTIAAKQAEITSSQQRIVNIGNKISIKTTAIANVKRVLAQDKAKLELIKTNLAELNKRKVQLETKIRNLVSTGSSRSSAQITKLKEKLKAVNQKIAAKKNELNGINTRIASNQKKLRTLNTSIANLRTQKQNTRKKIVQLKAKIQQLNTKNGTLRTAIADLNAKITQINSVVTNNQNKVTRLDRLAQAKRSQLTPVKNDIARLKNRINNLSGRIATNDSKLIRKKNLLVQTRNRIQYLRQRVPELRSYVASLENNLNNEISNLSQIRLDIRSLRNRINQTESQLANAIANRNAKYAEYKERHDLYNAKDQEAMSLGQSQTSIAITLGEDHGDNKVVETSNRIGEEIGLKLSKAQGNYWGAIRSENQGYPDGVRIGYASDTDRQAGIKDGDREGRAAAEDFANINLKPQFFKEFYKDLIAGHSNKLEKKILTSNLQKILEKNTDVFLELSSINLSNIDPVSSAEINQSLGIKSQIDGKISSFKTNLKSVIATQGQLSHASNTIVMPTNIPYKSFDCNGVYKNLSVFKSSCAAAYHELFRSRYLRNFRNTFERKYTDLFHNKTEDVRSINIEGDHESSYSKNYPLAEASGIKDGKLQIYNELYEKTFNISYADELPAATDRAKQNAKVGLSKWISTNPALTIVSSSVPEINLRGGSLGSIKIDMKNISPVDTRLPIKLNITNIQNAVMTNSQAYLQKVPGQSTVEFKDLNFQVNNDVPSGQKIIIEGEAQLPGHKYTQSLVEKFRVEVITVLNPKTTTALRYDVTPKIKGLRRIKIHSTKVAISAAVEKIPAGTKIVVAAIGENADMIRLKETEAAVGSLNVGSSKEYSFRYTFFRAAKHKKVNLQFSYIYMGELITSEVIELRPH